MEPIYDELDPQPGSLIDLEIKPTSSAGSQPDSPPRRKRLSDTPTEPDETPPPPSKPSGRRSLAIGQPTSESPSGSVPKHPNPENATKVSETPELRPRAARPCVAVDLAPEESPGLQTIVDPSLPNAQPASGRTNAEPSGEARTSQSPSLVLAGGLAAALVGALAWALAAMALGRYLGVMAIGVGLLVGGTVRVLGRGAGRPLGSLSVTLSVVGCLLGNILSAYVVLAAQKGLAPLAVLSHVCSNPVLIPAALLATFQPLDLLFYGIALYAGYHLPSNSAPASARSSIMSRGESPARMPEPRQTAALSPVESETPRQQHNAESISLRHR
jgi:hypothetical protein